MGSFPLTRGKPVERDGGGRGVGLIPAHAGKTPSRRSRTDPPRAHPRSRGENIVSLGLVGERSGSSPLTRGKLPVLSLQLPSTGLIPAHAGKTVMTAPRVCSIAAHPRSRGENRSCTVTRWAAAGSSPLTRGKPAWIESVVAPPGLIPAHAGKTPCTGSPR